MLMSYNCHVHKATRESPFFLTHLHNSRLPVFNHSRPYPLHTTGYVERAFHNMEVSYIFARENLVVAEYVRKAFIGKIVEKRDFCVGAKLLVKIPMCHIPPLKCMLTPPLKSFIYMLTGQGYANSQPLHA